jgi:hypothetical protein
MNYGLADRQIPFDLRPDRNQFEITLWDRKLSVKLNGDVVQRALWLREHEEFGEKESIALTGSYRGEGPDVIYSNLQLRTLLNPPDDF